MDDYYSPIKKVIINYLDKDDTLITTDTFLKENFKISKFDSNSITNSFYLDIDELDGQTYITVYDNLKNDKEAEKVLIFDIKIKGKQINRFDI